MPPDPAEAVYVKLPSGFLFDDRENHICKYLRDFVRRMSTVRFEPKETIEIHPKNAFDCDGRKSLEMTLSFPVLECPEPDVLILLVQIGHDLMSLPSQRIRLSKANCHFW